MELFYSPPAYKQFNTDQVKYRGHLTTTRQWRLYNATKVVKLKRQGRM